MDICDQPSIAIFSEGQHQACHVVSTLEDARALCQTCTVKNGKVFRYQGPSLLQFAAVSNMVARVKGCNGCFALLAVKVPGVLENWPHIVLGSRVHIAYKVRWLSVFVSALQASGRSSIWWI